MRKTKQQTLLGITLLLGIAFLGKSCKRDLEIQNQPKLIVNQAISAAKAHVDSIVLQQGNDSFIKKMGFEINWKKAIIDSANNIRVPISFNLIKLMSGKQITKAKTKDVFELYIKKDKGQTEFSIMQFMYVRGKYYHLRFTLTGEEKTKLAGSIAMQDMKLLSKEGKGNKLLSSTPNKTMISESGVMELVNEMYGPNVTGAVMYECMSGTWFDYQNCVCDWPENVPPTGVAYPELFMVVFGGSSPDGYQIVVYPFSFHPSEITDDPEYPDEPIGSGDPVVDCAGVTGGSAHIAECGCIGGTTGIEECPPICTVSAILSPIAPTVLPGSNIDLTATITTSGVVSITDKRFEVFYGGNWLESSIKSPGDPIDQGNTYTINNAEINILGKLMYRLKIEYTCNGVEETPIYSNVVSTYSQYTASAFSTKFASDMSSAWSKTVESTIANQGTKYEYGFAGYYDAGSREILIDGGMVSASASCSTLEFGINPSTITHSGPINPYYGANFTVGNFHTHPPLTYCSSSYSLIAGPSDTDKASTNKFPQIVRAYTTTVNGGHNINLPLKDYFTNSKTVTDY